MAEAVCAGNGITPAVILDVVTELLDKSIVTRANDATVARYRMLEPIGQYGLDKLREVARRPCHGAGAASTTGGRCKGSPGCTPSGPTCARRSTSPSPSRPRP
jgi:hypothetical protein